MLREAKKDMRKRFFAKRATLDAEYRKAADAAICAAVGALSMVKNAECIAAYMSDGTEVDLTAFMLECEKADKRIFLPRYSASPGVGYEMVEIDDLSQDLVTGKYGLPEPSQKLPAASAEQINNMLWLVPGVAFDKIGARLGRGKGIYDRLLKNSNGLSIGIFYECQRADKVPAGEHDQKLDMIVTEKVIINLKN
ncbi:MAG: 5-formyltetrahydrofolate cyclo-ligase [Victivallaceae bacterium]|nr:5-formyltetrahydrofolate cyclo-ligase [Victivallaceae bacterium]